MVQESLLLHRAACSLTQSLKLVARQRFCSYRTLHGCWTIQAAAGGCVACCARGLQLRTFRAAEGSVQTARNVTPLLLRRLTTRGRNTQYCALCKPHLSEGIKPWLNLAVEQRPRRHTTCPEFWIIEAVAVLPGFAVRGDVDFHVVLPLAGFMGMQGIEIVGASKAERRWLPFGALNEVDGGREKTVNE